jgi:hypothetical protein
MAAPGGKLCAFFFMEASGRADSSIAIVLSIVMQTHDYALLLMEKWAVSLYDFCTAVSTQCHSASIKDHDLHITHIKSIFSFKTFTILCFYIQSMFVIGTKL